MRHNRSQLVPVATPEVGGATLRRHVLDVEAERMMQLCARIGVRLRGWLKRMPDERAAMRYDRENFCHHPVLDKDGKHLTEPLIPDKDWLETADWYQKTMLGLLKEQRERAKMTAGKGGLAIDDATFEQELAELARQTIREMPEEELRSLLSERKLTIDVGGTTVADAGAPVDTPIAPADATEQAGTFPPGWSNEDDEI